MTSFVHTGTTFQVRVYANTAVKNSVTISTSAADVYSFTGSVDVSKMGYDTQAAFIEAFAARFSGKIEDLQTLAISLSEEGGFESFKRSFTPLHVINETFNTLVLTAITQAITALRPDIARNLSGTLTDPGSDTNDVLAAISTFEKVNRGLSRDLSEAYTLLQVGVTNSEFNEIAAEAYKVYPRDEKGYILASTMSEAQQLASSRLIDCRHELPSFIVGEIEMVSKGRVISCLQDIARNAFIIAGNSSDDDRKKAAYRTMAAVSSAVNRIESVA